MARGRRLLPPLLDPPEQGLLTIVLWTDAVLVHPFVPHATSQNVLRAQRLITNPPLSLREPLRSDRANAAELSPVERGVLRGLGVDRFAFRPTAPREDVVPPRLRAHREGVAV